MRDARRRSASNGRGAPTPGVRHGGDITGQMYFTTRTSRKKRTFVEGRRELMPGRTILGYCVGMCKTPVLLAGFVLLVYQLGIVTHVGPIRVSQSASLEDPCFEENGDIGA